MAIDSHSYEECFMVGAMLGLLVSHRAVGQYGKRRILELLRAVDGGLNEQTLESILFKN